MTTGRMVMMWSIGYYNIISESKEKKKKKKKEKKKKKKKKKKKDCLMCCPINKVSSVTKSFLALEGLREDKLCDTLQAMAPTNVKTVNETCLLHIESNLDRLGLLSPTDGQRSQQKNVEIALQSVLINKPKFLKAAQHTETKKIEISRAMVVKALSWRSRRASQHPAVQSAAHSWKSPTNLARSRAAPRRPS